MPDIQEGIRLQRLPKPNMTYYRSRNALVRRAVARSIRSGQTVTGRAHILDVAANSGPDMAKDATRMFWCWEKRSGLPYYVVPGSYTVKTYPHVFAGVIPATVIEQMNTAAQTLKKYHVKPPYTAVFTPDGTAYMKGRD